jgi:antagonist of KipI
LLTTVQDLGRWAGLHLGIQVGGAVDPFAAVASNLLVGNDRNAAFLEMTIVGPTLIFERDGLIAITGADLGAEIDGVEVELWSTQSVRANGTLSFSGRRSGARAYLAVAGGLAVEPWFGSRSTYLPAHQGGHHGRSLRAGDFLVTYRGNGWIPPHRIAAPAIQRVPPTKRPAYGDHVVLQAMLGPHATRFRDEALADLVASTYVVDAASNRMGLRLQGATLTHRRAPDVSSCGLPPGGIQVPGNRQPIVLLADRQTAGGYAMIATVISADIPYAAQCVEGDVVRF